MIKEHALTYANRGWLVIPTHSITEDGRCSCGQISRGMMAPHHENGKHPYTEHGYKDGSKDHAQIHLWWEMWPDANVSIVTGAKSNLIVLDVDVKNGGYGSLALLERANGPLPPTVRAQSGGGGQHIYFLHPGIEVRGRRGMKPGLDVMADGGKIVAPPSRHMSGNRYHWMEGKGPDDIRIAPLPRWLLIQIQTKRPPVKRRAKPTAWYRL